MNLINDKYLYLPPQFHSEHDICWGLVRELEEFLIDKKYIELTAQEIPINEEIANELKEYDGDIFSFLQEKGFIKEHNYVVRQQLIRGLILDSCYFLQEALMSSLKKRNVVAFSLFRRPLVYNMLIMIRLLTEEDFIDKFIKGKVTKKNKEVNFDPATMDYDDLKQTLTNHPFFATFFGKEIYDFVYDKKESDSLINMTNRALHPVTSFEFNKTGAMNINFAFSTDYEILAQWEYIYRKILFIIFFFVNLTDLVVFSNFKENEDLQKIFNERVMNRQILMSSKF